MKYVLNIFLIYLISMPNYLIAFEKNDALILVQGSSTLNCGLKPLPPLGYKVGRCVNGKWEFVSQSPSSSTLNCGLKPLPPLGYKVGRCVNGKWEFVSQSPSSSTLNCGLKPLPPLGYKVGRCVNGKWEFVSN